jgi:serine acetyltransferase
VAAYRILHADAGNILVGARARVAAGSMVLKPVEEDMLVAGNPAKVIGRLVDVGKDGQGHKVV